MSNRLEKLKRELDDTQSIIEQAENSSFIISQKVEEYEKSLWRDESVLALEVSAYHAKQEAKSILARMKQEYAAIVSDLIENPRPVIVKRAVWDADGNRLNLGIQIVPACVLTVNNIKSGAIVPKG